MEARAVRKHIRNSPKKMRRVVNMIRGKNVAEALNLLRFTPNKATKSIERTLRDAVYNVMDKNPEERVDEGDLIIKEITVDGGPMFKRFRPAARGRAQPIRRRTSHLTVVVGQSEQDAVES